MDSKPQHPDFFAESADRSWQHRLGKGQTCAGNIEINMQFLQSTGLLAPGKKILELGCGTGALADRLARQGLDITAADISPAAIEYGQKEHPGLRLQVASAEDLNFPDGAFDIVLSFDLFEHLPRVDRHLDEVARILRPGGYYLFQTPNKLSNSLYETLKTHSLKWKQYHPSLHTPRGLRRRLLRHGFKARFIKMNTINEFSVKKFQRVGIPTSLSRRINTARLPLFLQTNLYIIAQK